MDVQIDGRKIGPSHPTYFIADIAANHDGSLERAILLIELAKEAGADAAKFQHFTAEKIVSDHGFRTMGSQLSHQATWTKSVVEVYSDASVPKDWTPTLKTACDRVGITFFSSPYDFDAVDALDPYVPAYKIGSGDIDWLEELTHIASKDFAVDLGMGLLKVVAVGWASWGVLKVELLTVHKLALAAPGDAMNGLFSSVWKIGYRAIGLLALFAVANLALTRWRYTKKHRMTKDEVKREMREDEGDPMMRGARKRKHREMVKRNAVAETRQADVLVVNPTHIAIAIRYRKDESGAPRVLAKGKGVLAEAMRDAARSNGVPIVQDIPLARLLFKKVKVGGAVPADTYKAVAAILAFVYRLTGKAQAMNQ